MAVTQLSDVSKLAVSAPCKIRMGKISAELKQRRVDLTLLPEILSANTLSRHYSLPEQYERILHSKRHRPFHLLRMTGNLTAAARATLRLSASTRCPSRDPTIHAPGLTSLMFWEDRLPQISIASSLSHTAISVKFWQWSFHRPDKRFLVFSHIYFLPRSLDRHRSLSNSLCLLYTPLLAHTLYTQLIAHIHYHIGLGWRHGFPHMGLLHDQTIDGD